MCNNEEGSVSSSRGGRRDTLAVLGEASQCLMLTSDGGRHAFVLSDLATARDDLAELIEASNEMADAADAQERMKARARLRAALARVTGEA